MELTLGPAMILGVMQGDFQTQHSCLCWHFGLTILGLRCPCEEKQKCLFLLIHPLLMDASQLPE